MRETEVYAKLLKLRPALKTIQQISWEIGALDKRFPLTNLTPDEITDLLGIYQDLIDKAKEGLLNESE